MSAIVLGLGACIRAAEETPGRVPIPAASRPSPATSAETWYYLASYSGSTASQPLEREDCVWDPAGGYQVRRFSGTTLLDLREAPAEAPVAALRQLDALLAAVAPFRIPRGSRLPYEDAPVPEYLWAVAGSGPRLRQFAGHLPDWPDALRAQVQAVLAEAWARARPVAGGRTARMYAVPVLRTAEVRLEPGAGVGSSRTDWVRFFQRPFRIMAAADPPGISPAFVEYQGVQYQVHLLPATTQTP